MPTECIADLFGFAPVEGRRVEASFDGGTITSDAGGLLLGSTDRAIGLIDRVAQCFTDRRDPELIEHQVRTLVGQRVFGLALGYEDLNDHDHLRHDPLLAVLLGNLEAKRSDCAPIAGKSTLNRLELSRPEPTKYHRISHDGTAIETLLVDLFVEAHRRAPRQIVLDLDATDDPLHGQQEGRFFHGYYDGYCYLPLYVTCGRHLLAAKLRRSNIDGAAGADVELARIVGRIRASWPRVRILVRADSGFARESLMAWCEANGVDFVFGLARNPRLEKEIEWHMAQAEAESRRTGQPARRFNDFHYATLESWSHRRRVIGKAESTQGEANPRFIVTSLERAEIDGRYLYEKVYCARGDSGRVTSALWRTVSRNARWTCSPIVRRRLPCAPTSSACGCPRWPMSCSARCAESACSRPASPRQAADRSAWHFSRSARWSRQACGASSSPWHRAVPGRTTSGRPTPCSPRPPADEPDSA